MSTLLYEELGLQKDAPAEHIRKAYRKKALLTHPDRLPPNATPEQKTASEEMFRKVNNAYEVLSDPEKRKEYDIHGVWPPPETINVFDDMRSSSGSHSHSRHDHARRSSRSRSYHEGPFFPQHHHDSFSAFHFTDPFTLFDSIFGGGSRFQPHSSRNMFRSQSLDPFENMYRMESDIETFMDSIDRDPFGFGGFPFGQLPTMSMFPPIEPSPFGRSGWTSESFSTRTINGVTETVHQRIDSSGNEHVTRTLADGQERRFINGVEQSSQRRLPDNSTNRYLPSSSAYHRTQPMHDHSRGDYARQTSQPPSYSAPPEVYRADTPPAVNERHHDRVHRRSSNRSKYSHASHTNPDPLSHEDRQHHHHHKGWMQGGHW